MAKIQAGFNGGNGTGWTPLPYSGEGRVIKLKGYLTTAPIAATMIGGVYVNVSGPCLRGGDVVKVIFDEYQVDCVRSS
ncbi:hypothetical protein ANCDUO_25508 [Ancylostoma duodenale]|uniref:Uncharacterized protein n=1 Tax=Ancylostoma duodenale TaxID=51022 RepID=A0A0C2FHQ8_9BILA|nr:hypothetical protein ANCDUO_25508 [Ancylostoma duodenale]